MVQSSHLEVQTKFPFDSCYQHRRRPIQRQGDIIIQIYGLREHYNVLTDLLRQFGGRPYSGRNRRFASSMILSNFERYNLVVFGNPITTRAYTNNNNPWAFSFWLPVLEISARVSQAFWAYLAWSRIIAGESSRGPQRCIPAAWKPYTKYRSTTALEMSP